MAEQILGEREIEAYIRSFKLIPGTGGVFEVTVNDDLVFSKKQLGRHAEPGEVRKAIVDKLEVLKPASE